MEGLTPELVTAISTLGFPIVAWFMTFKALRDNEKRQEKRDEAQTARDKEMTGAINALRETIVVLQAEVKGQK